MAMWKKALVIVVASLVAVFPMVTQVAMARPLILGLFPTKQAAEQALGVLPTASQSSVVLPQGKELSNTQLQDTEGDGILLALEGAMYGAIAGFLGGIASYLYGCLAFHDSFSFSGLVHQAEAGETIGITTGFVDGLLTPGP